MFLCKDLHHPMRFTIWCLNFYMRLDWKEFAGIRTQIWLVSCVIQPPPELGRVKLGALYYTIFSHFSARLTNIDNSPETKQPQTSQKCKKKIISTFVKKSGEDTLRMTRSNNFLRQYLYIADSISLFYLSQQISMQIPRSNLQKWTLLPAELQTYSRE